MKLSVIIVNYNVKHFLEQCLKSVFRAIEDIEAEVWVVDNNSVDGSVEMVKDQFPNAQLIANLENTGFSVANNQAIRKSKGEYVLLLNPDTIVEEDTFSKCIQFMDERPNTGGLGVRMIDGKGSFLPESKRGLPTPEVALYKMIGLNKLFPKSKRFGKYHLGYLPESEINKVDILSGAFMFMRKSTLDKVGLLDEAFFMYGEDIDLSYRITESGADNHYYPETTIVHYKGESTKKQSVNYVRIFYKAMIIFAQKHYKGQHKTLFIFLINLSIYLRAGLALVTRFIAKWWMLILDVILIFSAMYLLKNYWEEHIKLLTEYPPEMMTIHLPYYTFVWAISMLFAGVYKKGIRPLRLIIGLGLGTIMILAIYGMLPNHLRFSRGIILFGTLSVGTLLLAWRSIYHYLRYRNLNFANSSAQKTIIVGSKTEAHRIYEIWKSSSEVDDFTGFVYADSATGSLGELRQLDEIVSIYNVTEIIFSSGDMSSSEMITWMNKIGATVSYKTVPHLSNYIIGSDDKNVQGTFLNTEIRLALSDQSVRKQKRAMDMAISLMLLLFFPLLIWFTGIGSYFKNCLDVLRDKKTWIGYADSGEGLPNIKKGIIATSGQEDQNYRRNLDALYAKNYKPSTDLFLLFNNFNKIGRP